MAGNDANTLLLLHGEELIDSSQYGVSIINSGVSISDAKSKFGGKSLYFNGSSKLYADVPISGDCTVDFWMYIDGYPTSYPSPMNYLGSSSLRGIYMHVLSSTAYFGASKSNASINAVSVSAISSGVWHHIAVVRSGTTTVFYVDGSAVASLTNSYTQNTKIYLGDLGDAPGNNFSGYIDEFRISNIARWTEDFTPPTEPYSSPAPPPAPETIQQLLSVRIAWSAVDGAASYNVYRNGTLLTSTTETTYIDLTTAENQEYTYGVSAVGPTGESEQATLTVYTKSGYFLYKPYVESATFQ